MNRMLRIAFSAVLLSVTAIPVQAGVDVFQLHDHPNGEQNPPAYGLRLDGLLGPGSYTFSFDYSDVSGMADVTLAYDDVAGTIRIMGRAYGGLDTGTDWDAADQGWIMIDFLYQVGVNEYDDCAGNPGDDLYVDVQDATNAGTVTLDGWGGDQVFAFSDKADASGCTFVFDNDFDPNDDPAVAADLSIYSGTGWFMPEYGGGFRDWVFIGERLTVGTEETSWGAMKTLYR